MTKQNPFVLEKEEYKRNINPLKHYIEDASQYLSISTGRHYDECFSFVKQQVRSGIIKDPVVHYLERNKHGDRVEKVTTMLGYLQDTIQNNQILAPTFTAYINSEEYESPLVGYILNNIKIRNKAKKLMFKAEMDNNEVEAAVQEVAQKGKKTSNNSCSGGHVSASTPLYVPTGHSTLTSNCRCTSGYGNANNEKMLSGNRHYHDPQIVINNIISIVNRCDLDAFTAVMAKYSLYIPSVRDVMQTIHRCSRQYWRNERDMYEILLLVKKLTDIQRAAFMYVGDLYNLMKFNDEFMRGFIGSLSKQIRDIHPDPKSVIDQNREELKILATQFFETELKGIKWDNMTQDQLGMVASTVLNIQNTLMKYSDFIRAILVTSCVPASLAYLPNSIREAALTSDTDSTIFTVQDWVVWYVGKLSFCDVAEAVAATMIFLAAETITHILAMMSANYGVRKDRLNIIAMKNEYKFSVFVPTQVGKHYFADITCQEGNIYAKSKPEIKGVHLKASNISVKIMEAAKAMMMGTIATIKQCQSISLVDKLREVAKIEDDIYKSIKKGESIFFKNSQIKPVSAYKKPEGSPYQQYLLWNEVFGDKYGYAPEPPYTASVISLKIANATDTAEWLAKIKDIELKSRLVAWLKKNNKTTIGAIHVPSNSILVHGVPEEILLAVDVRNIVKSMVNVFYLILETYGYYCMNDKTTRLVSDMDEYLFELEEAVT